MAHPPNGERFAAHALFAHLSPAEQVLVSRASREERFPAGRRLFSAGEPAQGCWLILRGRVTLDTTVPGRGEVVVQTLGPGELLGWSWLVPPYQWQFGATAVEPTVAEALDTIQLRALAEQDTRFGYALARILLEAMLQRLQATRGRLLDLYQNPNGAAGARR